MTTTTTITAAADACPAGVDREPVEVEPVSGPPQVSAWRSYLRRATGAALFHDPAWSAVVARVFGHQERHLLARRGERVVGVLPLMEVESRLGGRLLVSVPYGTYGGILAEDAEATDALARAAIGLVHERRARVLDLRSAEAVVPNLERVERYDGFVRDLPASVDELPAFFPKRARAAARQAREREHLSVVHDPQQLRIVWELYTRSMRRIGSINYPHRFFVELLRGFGSQAWVSVVWHRKSPVAGTLSLVYGDTIMPYILGIDERLCCPGAANLLYYDVMERAIRAGLRRWDYGRTRKDNPGSAGFKKNQGFQPRTLGYQRYVPLGQTAPELTPSHRRFRLARHIWPHLPLIITRPLGSWLARWLPG